MFFKALEVLRLEICLCDLLLGSLVLHLEHANSVPEELYIALNSKSKSLGGLKNNLLGFDALHVLERHIITIDINGVWTLSSLGIRCHLNQVVFGVNF